MDEKIREKFTKDFKDFVATPIIDNEDFLIFDWRNKNGSGNYSIRFYHDIKKGRLIITGDLGDCIACWYNQVTPEDMANYINSTWYFLEKFQASSNKFTYNYEDIRKDLEDIKEELLEKGDFTEEELEELEDDFDELNEVDQSDWKLNHFSEDIIEIMDKYDSPWWEGSFAYVGRRIDTRVNLWIIGYQEGLKQLRGEKRC